MQLGHPSIRKSTLFPDDFPVLTRIPSSWFFQSCNEQTSQRRQEDHHAGCKSTMTENIGSCSQFITGFGMRSATTPRKSPTFRRGGREQRRLFLACMTVLLLLWPIGERKRSYFFVCRQNFYDPSLLNALSHLALPRGTQEVGKHAHD